MAVRGDWRPLSGLICEIVNSVGQGNFTFVRGNVREFQTPMAVATMSTVPLNEFPIDTNIKNPSGHFMQT